jgi:hypothetical protein
MIYIHSMSHAAPWNFKYSHRFGKGITVEGSVQINGVTPVLVQI